MPVSVELVVAGLNFGAMPNKWILLLSYFGLEDCRIARLGKQKGNPGRGPDEHEARLTVVIAQANTCPTNITKIPPTVLPSSQCFSPEISIINALMSPLAVSHLVKICVTSIRTGVQDKSSEETVILLYNVPQ
ncbi:hypothetical protein BC937DRAFT_90198 [Endogone sp. FLAS-F59071]|nr:hypothetical protein BC937DRAFT_90198 [Endogone sp. FLAS-F59071]|eukprot:RUS22156.1 hypothetical protein BC937DRAFT_90198 [Endogone sp. FLAS-F59071]